MEDEHPTEPGAPEADDIVVAIWGDHRPHKLPVEPPPPDADIWGRPATPPPPPAQDDPNNEWPDLWGDHEGWRGTGEDDERRHGRLPPGRFALPEWWAATPKAKPRPPWRQRLHRR